MLIKKRLALTDADDFKLWKHCLVERYNFNIYKVFLTLTTV